MTRRNRQPNPKVSIKSHAPENLLDVRQLLECAIHLDPIARRDMLSAVKIAAEVLNYPMEMVPAAPAQLRPMLETASFGRRGSSQRRWANVRSLLARALRETGVQVRQRERAVLNEKWQLALAPLPKRTVRMAVVPFARWCSAQQLSPSDVSQETADQYLYEMEAYDLRFARRPAFCKLIRAWNNAAKYNPTWPEVTLAIQSRRDWYTRPLDDFPASFQRDVENMLRTWQSNSFNDETGRDSLIGRVTAARYRSRIRALSSALVASGWQLTDIRSLADIVEVNAMRTSLDYVVSRNGGAVNKQAWLDAVSLCTIAKYWVDVSPPHFDELDKLRNKVRMRLPKHRGMTQKNQDTLRIFDDDTMIRKFLELPDRLYRQHAPAIANSKRSRMAIQKALAIKILTHAPVRAKNLSSIELGKNLITRGSGRSRRVYIHFDACDVKNNINLDFELPQDAFKLLDVYTKEVRPRLICTPTPYLFPNSAAGPKLSSAFSQQIAREVKRALGVRLTAHQFRHLIGFIFLRDNPGGIEIVRQQLGHGFGETTRKHYAGMEARHAVNTFDQFLADKQAQLCRRRKKRKK